MPGRFGYDCAAVGLAIDVGRALSVMETQGIAATLPGPDFFIIDFPPEKTAALSLSRRLRDLGASVARDIITRGLPESIAYAREQRARRVLVVGGPKMADGLVRVIDLADGTERDLSVAAVLDGPERYFDV